MLTDKIKFTVEGTPIGRNNPSYHPFICDGEARVSREYSDNCKNYCEKIRTAASLAMRANSLERPFTGELIMTVMLLFPRPQSHFDSKGKVKESYRFQGPTKIPLTSSLSRSFEYACKGVIFNNDNQVTCTVIDKRWAEFQDSTGFAGICFDMRNYKDPNQPELPLL